jgi:transcriptional regulator with XRE-family HTH domain
MQLAMAATCSQRHLSFLELGRTKPSREMVLRLSSALNVPLRQSNQLLLSAGYAPVWPESDLGTQNLAQIRAALDHMLGQQEPFPAVVVDRCWNLLQANKGALALVDFLVGPLEPGTKVNLADALVAPNVLRPYLANWEEVVRYFVRTVEGDAAMDGADESAALLARLLAYDDVKTALAAPIPASVESPVLVMHFHKSGRHLNLFTTIATLGTPQDITVQELRIESFFPTDEETRAAFREWHEDASQRTED